MLCSGTRTPVAFGLLLACVLVVGLATLQAAPPVADPQLERKVGELLQQLDAPTRSARASAERSLLALGSGILKVLPAPELLPSLAVREAVNRIRGELERRHAQESVLASRVTLNGRKPLSAWLEEIREQSRNRVTVHDVGPELLERLQEFMIDRLPFWEALDGLSAKAGIELALEQTAGELRLTAARAGDGNRREPVSYSGPFRIQVNRVQTRRLFGDEQTRLVRCQLQLLVEPRLRPLFLQYNTADLSAETADPQSTGQPALPILPLSPSASYELPLSGGGRIPIQLDFRLPSKSKSQSMELKGTLRATMAADSEEIRFTRLGAMSERRGGPVARRRGGVTATLQRVLIRPGEADGRDLLLKVALTYDEGGPAFESHRSWMLHNRVFLESPEGKPVELNGGFETTLQSDGGVALEYRFLGLPGNARDYTFVYVAPTAIIDVPIEFQFDALPIAAASDADKE